MSGIQGGQSSAASSPIPIVFGPQPTPPITGEPQRVMRIPRSRKKTSTNTFGGNAPQSTATVGDPGLSNIFTDTAAVASHTATSKDQAPEIPKKSHMLRFTKIGDHFTTLKNGSTQSNTQENRSKRVADNMCMAEESTAAPAPATRFQPASNTFSFQFAIPEPSMPATPKKSTSLFSGHGEAGSLLDDMPAPVSSRRPMQHNHAQQGDNDADEENDHWEDVGQSDGQFHNGDDNEDDDQGGVEVLNQHPGASLREQSLREQSLRGKYDEYVQNAQRSEYQAGYSAGSNFQQDTPSYPGYYDVPQDIYRPDFNASAVNSFGPEGQQGLNDAYFVHDDQRERYDEAGNIQTRHLSPLSSGHDYYVPQDDHGTDLNSAATNTLEHDHQQGLNDLHSVHDGQLLHYNGTPNSAEVDTYQQSAQAVGPYEHNGMSAYQLRQSNGMYGSQGHHSNEAFDLYQQGDLRPDQVQENGLLPDLTLDTDTAQIENVLANLDPALLAEAPQAPTPSPTAIEIPSPDANTDPASAEGPPQSSTADPALVEKPEQPDSAPQPEQAALDTDMQESPPESSSLVEVQKARLGKRPRLVTEERKNSVRTSTHFKHQLAALKWQKRHDVAVVTSVLVTTKNELEQQQHKIRNLESQVLRTAQAQESPSEDLKASLENYRNDLENSQRERAALQTQVEGLKLIGNQQRVELEGLRGEKGNLQKQLEDVQESSKKHDRDVEKLQNDNGDLQKQVGDLQAYKTQHDADFKKVQEDQGDLQRKVKSLQASEKQHEADAKKLQEDKKDLEQQVISLQAIEKQHKIDIERLEQDKGRPLEAKTRYKDELNRKEAEKKKSQKEPGEQDTSAVQGCNTQLAKFEESNKVLQLLMQQPSAGDFDLQTCKKERNAWRQDNLYLQDQITELRSRLRASKQDEVKEDDSKIKKGQKSPLKATRTQNAVMILPSETEQRQSMEMTVGKSADDTKSRHVPTAATSLHAQRAETQRLRIELNRLQGSFRNLGRELAHTKELAQSRQADVIAADKDWCRLNGEVTEERYYFKEERLQFKQELQKAERKLQEAQRDLTEATMRPGPKWADNVAEFAHVLLLVRFGGACGYLFFSFLQGIRAIVGFICIWLQSLLEPYRKSVVRSLFSVKNSAADSLNACVESIRMSLISLKDSAAASFMAQVESAKVAKFLIKESGTACLHKSIDSTLASLASLGSSAKSKLVVFVKSTWGYMAFAVIWFFVTSYWTVSEVVSNGISCVPGAALSYAVSFWTAVTAVVLFVARWSWYILGSVFFLPLTVLEIVLHIPALLAHLIIILGGRVVEIQNRLLQRCQAVSQRFKREVAKTHPTHFFLSVALVCIGILWVVSFCFKQASSQPPLPIQPSLAVSLQSIIVARFQPTLTYPHEQRLIAFETWCPAFGQYFGTLQDCFYNPSSVRVGHSHISIRPILDEIAKHEPRLVENLVQNLVIKPLITSTF